MPYSDLSQLLLTKHTQSDTPSLSLKPPGSNGATPHKKQNVNIQDTPLIHELPGSKYTSITIMTPLLAFGHLSFTLLFNSNDIRLLIQSCFWWFSVSRTSRLSILRQSPRALIPQVSNPIYPFQPQDIGCVQCFSFFIPYMSFHFEILHKYDTITVRQHAFLPCFRICQRSSFGTYTAA